MLCAVQVLWECGGTLAAPAISGAVIHKALAFIAPKLVRSYGCLELELAGPVRCSADQEGAR
jgi:riboflavin biosynthesis pyrimidine reductase